MNYLEFKPDLSVGAHWIFFGMKCDLQQNFMLKSLLVIFGLLQIIINNKRRVDNEKKGSSRRGLQVITVNPDGACSLFLVLCG